MASIIDIYKKGIPTTGKVDTKGKMKSPIEKTKFDDTTLTKARHGNISTSKKYSDTFKNK
jgi:hypothetical protein